jgi:hypothetical protein
MLFPFEQGVELYYQLAELGRVFLLDNAIAEGRDFILFLGRHGE